MKNFLIELILQIFSLNFHLLLGKTWKNSIEIVIHKRNFILTTATILLKSNCFNGSRKVLNTAFIES